ncbi:MAG TPA: plastocyanin/azurin family copper-binding protein [bacterium]|jgi:plastocyanin
MNRLLNSAKIGRHLAIGVGILAVVLAMSCKENKSNPAQAPGGDGTPPANEIWMQNMAFTPASLTVNAGTTVRWVNKDGITHTVTSGIPGNPDGAFNSGNVAAGDTFRFTFTSSRTTYHYFCQIHPVQMQGTVAVQ